MYDFNDMRHYRKFFFICLTLFVIGLGACATQKSPALSPTSDDVLCPLPTVMRPTPPATIPKYNELDETTGLHMTGEMQQLDLATYRLVITGAVSSPLTLSYDALRCMPKREVRSTLVCPGFFEDEGTWTGVPLNYVLDLVELAPDADELVLKSADGYSAYVKLEEARNPRNILAYEWEGEPLPVLHGFPVRAVFPELYGSKWVKWLVEIRVR